MKDKYHKYFRCKICNKEAKVLKIHEVQVTLIKSIDDFEACRFQKRMCLDCFIGIPQHLRTEDE